MSIFYGAAYSLFVFVDLCNVVMFVNVMRVAACVRGEQTDF